MNEWRRSPWSALRRWLRDHAFMILPWVVIAALLVALFALWLTNTEFHITINDAYAVLASGDQQRIQAWMHSFGAWAPIVSLIAMTAQAIIVGIPATLILFANGVAFGAVQGAVLNITGRVISSLIAFWLARLLGPELVEKVVGRLGDRTRFDRWLDRWGGWAMFVTRVMPGMPSDAFSYLAGFTTLPTRTFLIATFFGFLPQSIIYAWFGAYAMDWFWAVMLGGSVIGGVLALGAIGWRVWHTRRHRG